MSQKILAFNTSHDGLYWVFGMLNVKYLAVGTLDRNALIN